MIIYDKQKNEIGYLYFKQRLFRKSELYFHFKQNNNTLRIQPVIIKSFKDWIIEFQLDKENYRFSTHKNHFKSLFKNGRQVAQFDKGYFHFFNRDSFNIIADDNIVILLLVVLATFNYLKDTNGGETFNMDFGNVLGSIPPQEGKWQPMKNG